MYIYIFSVTFLGDSLSVDTWTSFTSTPDAFGNVILWWATGFVNAVNSIKSEYVVVTGNKIAGFIFDDVTMYGGKSR